MVSLAELAPALKAWRDDAVAALGFLTRLPLPAALAPARHDLVRAVRAFPLVGAFIGLVGGAAFALALALGVPATPAALLAVLTTVLATGGLHEDGLADTADGFGGGFTRERKLAIMRDPRSGAYGLLALIFSVGLRTAALAALGRPGAATAALVAAHAGSRAALPALMRLLDPARADGLAAAAGRPETGATLWALGLGAAIVLVALGPGGGLWALLAAAAAALLTGALARRQIGGYTGDVLGAAQQVGEIVMLLCAAAS
jgi:adenosylcobinamide-GDP ribazoletransferase